VGDVEFVAAFDVDGAKVGLDLGKAIFAGPNNTIRFAPVAEVGISVQRGPTLEVDRHWALSAHRVGPGRPRHTGQESKLLAGWAAVPGHD
jgi:myo-inositol-1-phosphate synthase